MLNPSAPGSAGGRAGLRGVILALTALAYAPSLHADVKQLQWGGERAAAKKSSNGSALRFVRPNKGSSNYQDAQIQLAAYEEDAPRLTSGRETESETRSVVVSRGEESSDGFRAVQLPSSLNTNNSNAEDSLRSPFADNPEEQPQSPAFSTPPARDNNSGLQVDPSGRYAQPTNPDNPNDAAAAQQQPQVPLQGEAAQQTPPATNPGDPGQFQPVLPSGPAPDQSPPTRNTPQSELNIKAESEKAQDSCEKSLENLRAYTVDKVKLDIAIVGTEGEDYPFECSIDDGSMHAGRCWEQITYMWKASALCHKPLYFEDEQLERYGHSFSPCIQPFVSGAHFFTRPFVLPYCMGVEPPNECIYALGHYRPGSCAPYMCNPVPLSARGALFEAGAVVGAAAILP